MAVHGWPAIPANPAPCLAAGRPATAGRRSAVRPPALRHRGPRRARRFALHGGAAPLPALAHAAGCRRRRCGARGAVARAAPDQALRLAWLQSYARCRPAWSSALRFAAIRMLRGRQLGIAACDRHVRGGAHRAAPASGQRLRGQRRAAHSSIHAPRSRALRRAPRPRHAAQRSGALARASRAAPITGRRSPGGLPHRVARVRARLLASRLRGPVRRGGAAQRAWQHVRQAAGGRGLRAAQAVQYGAPNRRAPPLAAAPGARSAGAPSASRTCNDAM
jgi:hypothetical protein